MSGGIHGRNSGDTQEWEIHGKGHSRGRYTSVGGNSREEFRGYTGVGDSRKGAFTREIHGCRGEFTGGIQGIHRSGRFTERGIHEGDTRVSGGIHGRNSIAVCYSSLTG